MFKLVSMALMAALSLSVSAFAQEEAEAEAEMSEAEQIARAYMDAYSALDWNQVRALTSEDFRFYDPTYIDEQGENSDPWEGQDAVIAMMDGWTSESGMLGFRYTTPLVFENAGITVFVGRVITPYFAGPGREWHWESDIVSIIRVEDGKVVEHLDYVNYQDAFEGLRQIAEE